MLGAKRVDVPAESSGVGEGTGVRKIHKNPHNNPWTACLRRPSPNTRASTQQPWQSFVRYWFSVTLAPLLAIGVSVGVCAHLDVVTHSEIAPNSPNQVRSTQTYSSQAHSHSSAGVQKRTETVVAGTAGRRSLGADVPHKTLVALGDSIPFGYNLPGATPGHPSKEAYPYHLAMGQAWQVKDLAVPGLTSGQLLSKLATPVFQQDLREANLVVLDIGSNDLLDTTQGLQYRGGSLTAAGSFHSTAQVAQAVTRFSHNLQAIVLQIQSQTTAPLILVNLYDPFPDASLLHDLGEQAIAAANGVLDEVAAADRLPVANAYAAFNHHQGTLVRLAELDVHPTLAGQQALAEAVQRVLLHPLSYQPVFYAMAPEGALIDTKPSLGPFAMAWLHGPVGLLVTGKQGTWWQVVTRQGNQGYVAANKVNLLLRPWNNVTFASLDTRVTFGQWRWPQPSQASQAVGFVWQGQTYLPAASLGLWTHGQEHYGKNQQEVDLTTPLHSGLIQSGLLPGQAPTAPKAAGVAGTETAAATLPPLQFTPGNTATVTLKTAGLILNIDGEPIHLANQPVLWQGRVFLPAKAVWTQLGGQVQNHRIKPGLFGLRLLFPSGS
ncbi:SGNH/GDSL hydrolase family protein [Alicyclobacillaceae bacterium I2511]|nr:SGNH/GDSL hydrolase family protein [Alicyclobacillaceae bacterium I2511]